MSLLADLQKVYQANQELVGKTQIVREATDKYPAKTVTLIPESHFIFSCGIEVLLSEAGKFISAKVVADSNARKTLMPVTKDSAVGSSGFVPMPLHDKPAYVTADFVKYADLSKAKHTRASKQNKAYIAQLKEFARGFQYDYPLFAIVLAYTEQGTLMKDLLDAGILKLKDGVIPNKWTGEDAPAIYKQLGGDPLQTRVRFQVAGHVKPWEDSKLMKAWSTYYYALLEADPNVRKGYDFITEEDKPVVLATSQLKGIRYAGDRAKLISSNDRYGFTFRGRFDKAEDALHVGYRASQQATLALKWLIDYQGYSYNDGDSVLVMWGDGGLKHLPSFLDQDAFSFLHDADVVKNEPKSGKALANYFKQILVGKYTNGEVDRIKTERVHFLVLGSATSGRLDIMNYVTMLNLNYFDLLADWLSKTSCLAGYGRGDTSSLTFYSLAMTLAGQDSTSSDYSYWLGLLINQLLHGKVGSQALAAQVFNRAVHPYHYNGDSKKWEKDYRTAVKFLNYYKGDGIGMLDKNRDDRDYLFGRLLGVADVIEDKDLYETSRERETWAKRYLSAFSTTPARVWKSIYLGVNSGVKKDVNRAWMQSAIDEIMDLFKDGDFNDRALGFDFLQGFSHQRNYMRLSKADKKLADQENVKQA